MASSQLKKQRKAKSSFWKNFSLSERITWTGTILGLIVDTLAILQLMGGVFLPFSDSFPKVSPYYAISIWLLAIFTYSALLHSYWEKHLESESLRSSFSGFLFFDLLLEFRKPFLLFTPLLLIIVFFPIANSIDTNLHLLESLCGTLLFFGIMLLGILKFTLRTASSKDQAGDMRSVLKNMQKRLGENKSEIEANWEYWEKRIRAEFERKWGVTDQDFDDIKTLKGYGEFEFKFIFATFASKFPDKARFGTLWEKDEVGEYKKYAEEMLVNLEKYNRERFWIN